MNWMIKNSNGKPDAMLTFATISFITVTLNLVLATFGTVEIFGQVFTFVEMSSGAMASYLGPSIGAYVARRYTDKGPATETTSDGKTVTVVVSDTEEV